MRHSGNARTHTFCRTAEAVAGADAWGQITSLDHEHTHVHQHEGKVRQRRQRAVVDPARKRIHGWAVKCVLEPVKPRWVQMLEEHSRSSICDSPPQRPEAQVEPKESDAHRQSDKHARLLGVLVDQEHPAAENQLAAHLDGSHQKVASS